MFGEKANQQLVVGGNFVVGFKVAVAIVGPAFDKNGGVGGHPAVGEAAGGKGGGAVVAEDFVGVGGADVDQVGEDAVGLGILQGGDDGGDHLGVGIDVVGIEDTNDVAGGQGQAFVEGVVHTAIGFGDKVGNAIAVGVDDMDSTVGGGTIDKNVFDLGIILTQDRFNRVLNSSNTIVNYSNDRDFSH